MTGMPPSDARRKERGLALLVVLWGVTAAALLVMAFNVIVRSGAIFVTAEIELTQAEALADAGLEIAAAHLIDEDAARRWRADGKPRHIDLGDAVLTITIDDPNGLVDVNKASEELLLALLTWATGTADAAKPMLDSLLRLRGDTPASETKPLGDARTDSPIAAGPASPPPQGPAKLGILDVTQLRRMEGMTPALYRRIAPYVTVYGRDGRISPFHAPRAVLAALPGLTEADVDRFLAQERADGDRTNGPPESLAKASAFLSRETGPAYIVSVAVAKPGRPPLPGRQFVIATGLDTAAPYRLLTTTPLAAPVASQGREAGS
jgi:general secretion pathway protein K